MKKNLETHQMKNLMMLMAVVIGERHVARWERVTRKENWASEWCVRKFVINCKDVYSRDSGRTICFMSTKQNYCEHMYANRSDRIVPRKLPYGTSYYCCRAITVFFSTALFVGFERFRSKVKTKPVHYSVRRVFLHEYYCRCSGTHCLWPTSCVAAARRNVNKVSLSLKRRTVVVCVNHVLAVHNIEWPQKRKLCYAQCVCVCPID